MKSKQEKLFKLIKLIIDKKANNKERDGRTNVVFDEKRNKTLIYATINVCY